MIVGHLVQPKSSKTAFGIPYGNARSYVGKRILDLSICLPLFVLLLPLFALVAILIKLESAGPVLFKQRRRGKQFEPFTMWKLRSLRPAPDPHERYEMQETDPRITRVGSFIRRTSIDELPQLFNVIAGSMSLVGPRPLIEWESQECLALHGERFLMKPGITGLSQVIMRNAGDLASRSEWDLEYVRRWSIWLDLRILFLDTPRVLFGSAPIYSKSRAASHV
jgi:lipopolysaccharide/colanic/teichoic acid biosynthesis glycosyltransferase